MKISCCCFTCIVGEKEEEDKKEESNRLLEEEADDYLSHDPIHSKAYDKPSYSRSISGFSSSSTIRELSTESAADVTSESTDASKSALNKFSKAVGVLKKYNVMSSKYSTKELQTQLSSSPKLCLKVGIKMMPKSATVKLSVIEAHNVLEVLRTKDYHETGGTSDSDSATVVQVRTKVLPSEVRGHTRKYEIQGSITGALKLKNETIHTIDLQEFLSCSIRFRLYYVLKHQRDKLLGEYVLDVSNLNLIIDESKPTFTSSMFEMYDPSSVDSMESVNIPETVPVGKLSMTGSSSGSERSSTPKIQRQSKLLSQESEGSWNQKDLVKRSTSEDFRAEKYEDEVPPKSPFSKAFKSIRHSATHMRSKESSKEKDTRFSPESEQLAAATENLKVALKERTEKVQELEDSTAAMASTAGSFTALSVKLKEKYKYESGRKSKSSES